MTAEPTGPETSPAARPGRPLSAADEAAAAAARSPAPTLPPLAPGAPVHFFLHVPKCAGTTVERHLARTLGPAFLMAPRWQNPLRGVIGNRYPGLSPEDVAQVRAVSGHSLSQSLAAKFPGRPVRRSVLLRDPVSYLVSFYNYRWARHEERGEPAPPAFSRWRRTQRRNPISRFLLHRYFEMGYPRLYLLSTRARFLFLERAFEDFHFVGSYKRCSEALAGISTEMGADPEVAPENVGHVKRLSVSDLTRDEIRDIEAQNVADYLLHARWKDRGFERAENPVDAASASTGLADGDGLSLLGQDLASAGRRMIWRGV